MTTISQQHLRHSVHGEFKACERQGMASVEVIIPRRSITGRLVRGQVWRRHDGRHWIYKRFLGSPASS